MVCEKGLNDWVWWVEGEVEERMGRLTRIENHMNQWEDSEDDDVKFIVLVLSVIDFCFLKRINV